MVELSEQEARRIQQEEEEIATQEAITKLMQEEEVDDATLQQELQRIENQKFLEEERMIESDAELARALEEERKREEDAEKLAIANKAAAELKKKAKEKEDRAKYSAYLKSKGYQGRSLGNMKIHNLANLYREVQAKYKVDPQIIKLHVERTEGKPQAKPKRHPVFQTVAQETGKEAALESTSKRRKQIGTKKTRRPLFLSDESSTAATPPESPTSDDKAEFDKYIVIREEEEEAEVDAVPLQTRLPDIIMWDCVMANKKAELYIFRKGNERQHFSSFHDLLKSVTREDLEQMHQIGEKEYGKQNEMDLNFFILDKLRMMFNPDEAYGFNPYSRVLSFTLFENCRVYQICKEDNVEEYHLVEGSYMHSLGTLVQLTVHKIRNVTNLDLARTLIKKILDQLEIRRNE